MKFPPSLTRIFKLLVLQTTFLLFLASPALALQAHGYKGLYVHQGAHFFLIVSMVIFAFHLKRSTLIGKKAWLLMSCGAWLLFLWNIWAFSGHFLELFIPEKNIVLQPLHKIPFLQIESWKETLYYILKMDHLLSVPSALFFYFGLKEMLADISSPSSREKRT